MNIIKTGLMVFLLGCWCTVPLQAQNTAIIKKSARTAAAGISVSTRNGQTTIVYKGKEVWTGKTSGKVTGKAKAVNDKEYAAAYDGNKVIWENVPGAAAHLK